MGTALAVDCPAYEPTPVLLEQLTQLAAASVAPAAKPWWHRLGAKTGAAAFAGVLMISGATADAEHASAPPTQPKVSLASPAPTSKPAVRQARPERSSAWMPTFLPLTEVRGHGRLKPGHRGHAARNHEHAKGNSRAESVEMSAPLVEEPLPQASLLASSNLLSGQHPHGHARQSKSHR